MKKIIKADAFKVIGIEARTNNVRELGPDGIISVLWKKFIEQNLLNKIPNRTSDAIISGYTEYASNKDGDYTFFIGARVHSTELIPENMVVKEVPAGVYAVLTSEKGAAWEVVQRLWHKIWTAPETDKWNESQRAYQFDYEIYDERAHDPHNAQVDVYLGLRPMTLTALDVDFRKKSIYPEPFASMMSGREKRTLGDLFGIKKFGINLTVAKPGGRSSLLHAHSLSEEFIYVVKGQLTLRTEKSKILMVPGDCAGFIPGEGAHTLINEGTEEAHYLEVGDREAGDSTHYPEDDIVAKQDSQGSWYFEHKDGTPY